jgi:hypothetical protein
MATSGSYHWLASAVIDATANVRVFPFAKVTDVIPPCKNRSFVAAESQISMATTADHAAPAVHDTALLFVDTPPDGAPNAVAPRELPPAV